MVFCNIDEMLNNAVELGHNPYFSRWFSAIKIKSYDLLKTEDVTILILVDGFLQF